jgi:hypothetical protein
MLHEEVHGEEVRVQSRIVDLERKVLHEYACRDFRLHAEFFLPLRHLVGCSLASSHTAMYTNTLIIVTAAYA